MLQGKRMGEECGLCLTQLLQGAEECWNILLALGSVRQQQQQLSCPAQSWECAVLTVQALGLGTQEAPADSRRSWRGGRPGQSPLPALALLSCSPALPGGPRAAQNALGSRNGGNPHTAPCGVLLWLQEAFTGRGRLVALSPCSVSQGQEHKPAMKGKVLVVCYLDT